MGNDFDLYYKYGNMHDDDYASVKGLIKDFRLLERRYFSLINHKCPKVKYKYRYKEKEIEADRDSVDTENVRLLKDLAKALTEKR